MTFKTRTSRNLAFAILFLAIFAGLYKHTIRLTGGTASDSPAASSPTPEQQAASANDTTTLTQTASVASKVKNPDIIISPQDPRYRTYISQFSGKYTQLLRPLAKKYSLSPQEIKSTAKALAVTRLSQVLYEGEIATATTISADEVSIQIPEYKDVSNGLLEYLKVSLSDVTNAHGNQFMPDLISSVVNRDFDYLGQQPQQIAIKRNDADRKDGTYEFASTVSIGNNTPVTTKSLLNAKYLDRYVAFAQWLPK